jgi:hypothetical protein
MNVLGRFLVVTPFVVLGFACKADKSENWLAPTVAGPIPGITITTPKPVEPGSGARVAVDTQPITLIVDNSSSNGPRPLSYAFEVAADANFTTKVFTREGISPGSGRTSLRLPDALATGRTYFWRSQAQDGANSSGFSSPVSFSVFTPVIIGAPALLAPGNNTKVTSSRPTFTWSNAPTSGPVVGITYEIEVGENDAFVPRFVIWATPQSAGQTSTQLPIDGPLSKYFFWHVRGFDTVASSVGPWSETRAFQMPDPPSTGGGGGGGAPVPSGPGCPTGPKTPDQLVACVASVKARVLAAGINLNHGPGECGRFEVTKRVAWELRADSVGLMAKVGSQNGCSATNTLDEPKYGVDVVMYPDGTFADILCGGGDGNTPCWGTGTTSPSLWRAPFNPN